MFIWTQSAKGAWSANLFGNHGKTIIIFSFMHKVTYVRYMSCQALLRSRNTPVQEQLGSGSDQLRNNLQVCVCKLAWVQWTVIPQQCHSRLPHWKSPEELTSHFVNCFPIDITLTINLSGILGWLALTFLLVFFLLPSLVFRYSWLWPRWSARLDQDSRGWSFQKPQRDLL